jgi:hypothetical protein
VRERRPPDKQTRGISTLRDSPQSVSTKGIKAFVSSHLPSNHPLRQVVLAEKEKLMCEEFLAKMEVWLVLLDNKG